MLIFMPSSYLINIKGSSWVMKVVFFNLIFVVSERPKVAQTDGMN